MKTIKQLIIAAALATTLGPVVNVQAMDRKEEHADEAVQLQAANEALLTAAYNGNLNDAIEALGAGANVNTASHEGATPLLLASQNGHSDVVEALIKVKAEVDKATQNAATPLLMASHKGHIDIVNILLGAKAEIDKADHEGAAPLLMASQDGHTEIVAMLIQAKAEIDKANHKGLTPLWFASQNGHSDAVQALLNAKAEVDNARPADGVTPLLQASYKGHIDIVNMLLEAKAEIDKANHEGVTPLSMASQNGHSGPVEALLRAKAEVDKARQDGVTPLFMANKNGHIKIVQTLITHDANPNLASNQGYTALSVARSDMLEAIAQARAARPQPEEPVRCVQQAIRDLPVMLALAVAAEPQGHQKMVPWLLQSAPQAREQAGDCSICMESFVDLVGKKAELRRTHEKCWHIVCDICEQKQRLISHMVPLTRCPMGCHNSGKPAFEQTAAQAQEFERLQQLFLGAAQEEKKDGNDDEPHFFD